jgi:hypothetical protein
VRGELIVKPLREAGRAVYGELIFRQQQVVLPENTYCLIFLNYFRREVNLVSSVIVAAEEDPEP